MKNGARAYNRLERYLNFNLDIVRKSACILACSFILVACTYFFYTPLIINLTICLILSVATWKDLSKRLIPNLLIGYGVVCAGIFLLQGELLIIESLSAAFSIFGILMGIRWLSLKFFSMPGIGMGDLKLFFVLGFMLGWDVFWVLYLSILVGGLWAIVGISVGRLSRKSHLPFAPFITVAFLVGHFVMPWNQFWSWWAV